MYAMKQSFQIKEKNPDADISVLFVDVGNDGFSLTDTREPIEENDLPIALKIVKKFRATGHLNVDERSGENKTPRAFLVEKSVIRNATKHHLIGRWYKIDEEYKNATRFPLVTLGEVCQIHKGKILKTRAIG